VSSRFSTQLRRLGAPEPAAPLAGAGAAGRGNDKPTGLAELRERMAALLEREGNPDARQLEAGEPEFGESAGGPKRPPRRAQQDQAGLDELPFLGEEGDGGVLWVRRLAHSRARHVGAIPVESAGDADMSLLGLIGLAPELCGVHPRRLLYLDTETTGLGGAGTLAFLVGLAFFDDQGALHLEQLFLDGPGNELALLNHVERRVRECDGIVTFNGKSFDWPLLKARRVMNRQGPLPERPHLDLLHLSRRLHKPRLKGQRLIELERQVLGFDRGEDDIPGAEIAPRYLHYLRSGDASGLLPVIEHNAWDVYSMAALVGLYGDPVDLLHPEDLAQLAAVLGRTRSFDRGLDLAQMARERGAGLAAERSFAQLYKAKGDRALALESFENLAREVDDPRVRLELAKLYEHFHRDFERALSWLAAGTGESPEATVRRRTRLESKRARRVT
jgi:uncharacterized protein